MKCERGDHGEMFVEKHPAAYRCETCGHMAYPAYADHVADGSGTGAKRYLSPKAKKQRKAIIERLVERGYTNGEIADATGYEYTIVRVNASDLRKLLSKQNLLDKVQAGQYN